MRWLWCKSRVSGSRSGCGFPGESEISCDFFEKEVAAPMKRGYIRDSQSIWIGVL